MLKRHSGNTVKALRLPAAFRRLCVETGRQTLSFLRVSPAAFRRLCVETSSAVVTPIDLAASRLQAAVC